MFCLDTNIFIDLIRNDPKIVKKIESAEEDQVFYITPITLAELYKGAYRAKNQAEAIGKVKLIESATTLLDFSRNSCVQVGKEHQYLKSIGKETQESDLMIGCIAKVNNLTMVTRNKKHFENIPNLKIEVW